MGIGYWFRAGMMILAFVGTVLIIRSLNTPGGGDVRRMFGLTTGPAAPTRPNVDLCPTRVHALELGDGQVIRENGMTWVRRSRAIGGAAPEIKLDQVAVEKWFSTFCRIDDVTKVAASADVLPVLKVEFVSGPPQTLIRSAGGDYEWMGQPFRSEKMTEALRALLDLPAAPAP